MEPSLKYEFEKFYYHCLIAEILNKSTFSIYIVFGHKYCDPGFSYVYKAYDGDYFLDTGWFFFTTSERNMELSLTFFLLLVRNCPCCDFAIRLLRWPNFTVGVAKIFFYIRVKFARARLLFFFFVFNYTLSAVLDRQSARSFHQPAPDFPVFTLQSIMHTTKNIFKK